MSSSQTIAFRVTGRVQGVGFRHFTVTQARAAALVGWVRNNADGSVSGEATGSPAALKVFKAHLQQGPPFSQVDVLDIEPLAEPTQRLNAFTVVF